MTCVGFTNIHDGSGLRLKSQIVPLYTFIWIVAIIPGDKLRHNVRPTSRAKMRHVMNEDDSVFSFL